MSIRSGLVRVGPHSVVYREAGDGPPLLLLHGFTQDSRAWRPQLEGLSGEHRVIAWDAPGAGGSSDPTEPFGIEAWTAGLVGFLDELGIDAAHVAGLSWGGLLAQQLYYSYPKRVRSLVLADTYAGWAGSLPGPIPEQRLAACLADSQLPPAEFVARYLPAMFSPDPPSAALEELAAIMVDFHPIGFRLMATALARTDTSALLQTIRIPTLLLWGDADARAPIAIAEQFRAAIPGARLEVIRGAGHLSNLEDPEGFTAAMRAFLAGR